MEDKIMAGGNLEEVLERMGRACALLRCAYQSAKGGDFIPDALGAVCDLMEGLHRDFQADVEAAEEVDTHV